MHKRTVSKKNDGQGLGRRKRRAAEKKHMRVAQNDTAPAPDVYGKLLEAIATGEPVMMPGGESSGMVNEPLALPKQDEGMESVAEPSDQQKNFFDFGEESESLVLPDQGDESPLALDLDLRADEGRKLEQEKLTIDYGDESEPVIAVPSMRDLELVQEVQERAPEEVEPIAQPELAIEIAAPEVSDEMDEVKQKVASEPLLPASREKELPDEQVSQEGIDTEHLDKSYRGNWLFKRIWWDTASAKYEELRADVQAIQRMHLMIAERIGQLKDAMLSPLGRATGLDATAVITGVDRLVERAAELPEEKEAEGAERAAVIAERAKDELSKVMNFEQRIGEVRSRVNDTLSRVRKHEQQAWENVREISQTLSDEEARRLFFGVDKARADVANLKSYLEKGLALYLDQLERQAVSSVGAVIGMLNDLATRGLSLREEAVEKKTEGEAADEKADDQGEADSDDGEDEDDGEWSLLGTIMKWIGALIGGLISLIRLPFDLIFGS